MRIMGHFQYFEGYQSLEIPLCLSHFGTKRPTSSWINFMSCRPGLQVHLKQTKQSYLLELPHAIHSHRIVHVFTNYFTPYHNYVTSIVVRHQVHDSIASNQFWFSLIPENLLYVSKNRIPFVHCFHDLKEENKALADIGCYVLLNCFPKVRKYMLIAFLRNW